MHVFKDRIDGEGALGETINQSKNSVFKYCGFSVLDEKYLSLWDWTSWWNTKRGSRFAERDEWAERLELSSRDRLWIRVDKNSVRSINDRTCQLERCHLYRDATLGVSPLTVSQRCRQSLASPRLSSRVWNTWEGCKCGKIKYVGVTEAKSYVKYNLLFKKTGNPLYNTEHRHEPEQHCNCNCEFIKMFVSLIFYN